MQSFLTNHLKLTNFSSLLRNLSNFELLYFGFIKKICHYWKWGNHNTNVELNILRKIDMANFFMKFIFEQVKIRDIFGKIAFLPFSFKTFSPSFNCRRFCSSTFQRVNNIGFEATNLRCKKCCEEACDLIYVFSDMIDSHELLIMLGWSAIRSFVPYLEAYFCFVNMSKEEFSICLFTYCQTNICEPEQIISLKVWSESLTEWDVWMWNWILEGVIKTWEQIEKKHKNTSSRSSKTAENSQVGLPLKIF